MDTKLCVVCGADLPLLRRSDRRYCGGRCRVRAHRVRAEASRRRPRKAEENSGSAAAVVGVAAAGVALAALRWQLTIESAHRRTLETEAKRAEATLADVRKERDAAAEAARQAREKTAQLRRQLQREQEERQHLQGKVQQLQEELARQKQRLHTALVKGDEFYGKWHMTQTALGEARNRLAAYEAQSRSSSALHAWRERAAYLEQQVLELSEHLTESERRRVELEGDVHRAAQLAAQVRALEKQLEDSHQKQGRLARKLERAKENHVELLEQKRQDRDSGPLLGKVGAVLGLGVAAGVAAMKLTGRESQKSIAAPASQRLLPKPSKR